nr:MAG TPA: hypothetical protein [Caudoviricetes sp.]
MRGGLSAAVRERAITEAPPLIRRLRATFPLRGRL